MYQLAFLKLKWRPGVQQRVAMRVQLLGRRLALAARAIMSAIAPTPPHAAGTAHEGIEHLKDARWQLTETQARFRELLDSQSELIVRRDATGRVMFANAAFCKTFALPRDAQPGVQFWPHVLESELAPLNQAGRARVAQLVETVSGPRWIEWDTHHIAHHENGHEVQFVGRDVTDERRLQAELRAARDLADAANRAKSRFLAAMSHEIRTPMNGILGMTSLLQETEQTDEQKSYSRAIDQSAKSLLALIDEILDFSKIEAGKLQLTAAPFSLRACIASALELMTPNAARRGNQLVYSVSDNVPAMVIGDSARVRQIVLNLVSNAVKFTENGRIDVTVERLPDNQEAPSATPTYELTVEDNGIGLSEETKAILFQEFEQADDARLNDQGGTGLGLAISKRLASAMGGDIRADGNVGRGATFTVSLPLPDATYVPSVLPEVARGASHTLRRAARAAAPPHILVAEDNDINALLARRICERLGCTVTLVKDGQGALAAIEQSTRPEGRPFDLILMDVFMPKLDGLDATRAIKAHFATQANNAHVACPPIVALTANAFADDRDRCRAAGMDDYLAKPFDVQQLRTVLQRWLPDAVARRVG